MPVFLIKFISHIKKKWRKKNPKGSFLVLSRDSTTVCSESIRRVTAEGSESQSQFLVIPCPNIL